MVDLFCSKSTEIEKIFEYKIREKTGETKASVFSLRHISKFPRGNIVCRSVFHAVDRVEVDIISEL